MNSVTTSLEDRQQPNIVITSSDVGTVSTLLSTATNAVGLNNLQSLTSVVIKREILK